MADLNAPRVLIAGVHQSSDAYPNTRYRVEHLTRRFNARHVQIPLWTTPQGGVAGLRAPLRILARALAVHAAVAWKVVTGPRADVVYLPYPAIGMALLLALLPPWWRPRRMVADGFISIYDTVVKDRGLWREDALRSRALWTLERQAFRNADAVVVDTPQNARYYAGLFRLRSDRFVAIPLATNQQAYLARDYAPRAGKCRVLFIGTLVPLQGVATIAAAIRLLSKRDDLHFRILGDGSDATKLEAALDGLPNVTWQRRWHSAAELAEAIADADICLGIFGNTAKAQRVCPYKLYAYAAVGRATITGDTAWVRSIPEGEFGQPFHRVPVNDAQALADAIEHLLEHPSHRERLARDAGRFYRERLANERSLRMLEDALSAANQSTQGT